MTVYNKLVRDKIPDIIAASGKRPVIRVLSDEDYINELDKKLIEEGNEYQADKSLEELADMLEVIYAIAAVKGCSINELQEICKKKAEERGRFVHKLFLEGVENAPCNTGVQQSDNMETG